MGIPAAAQFTTAQLLRPSPNFIAENQGTTRSIPFPGTLDENAGKPGYSPDLLSGVPVPLGSRVLIWLPQIFNAGSDVSEERGYVYTISFRLRNLFDFRNPGSSGQRRPYHNPRQQPGVPDTSGPTTQPRFVIPATSWNVGYQVSESTLLTRAPAPALRLYAEGIMPNVNIVGTPSLPGGLPGDIGRIQQGIEDPAVALANDPIWMAVLIDAYGDDMIINMSKPSPNLVIPTWDFTSISEDENVANFYTRTDETGIYVLTGSMP